MAEGVAGAVTVESEAQMIFARVLKVENEGLNFQWMVEPKGFEPLTPTMPLWCSTN